jgi:Fe-S cluster assembly protein SufD
MIDELAQRRWFHNAVHNAAPAPEYAAGDCLTEMRQHASASLDTLPVIERKLEDWRYSRIDSLLAEDFYLDHTPGDAPAVIGDELFLATGDADRLVFVNGHFSERLSSRGDLPDGITLGSLRDYLNDNPDPLRRWLGSVAGQGSHLFNALNTALIDDGLFLHVAAGVCLERPIELLCLGATRSHASLVPVRNLVVLEAGAKAELVEHCTGEATARYFYNGLTEILLDEGASLEHVRIQNESPGAWHLGSVFLSLNANSRYRGISLMLGGAWSRTEFQIGFSGEAARCELDGLYTVGDGQLADVHLNVEHSVPSCASRVNFRGLLYGKGRGVFDGCIHVGETAQQTDAQLRNDNLMLSADAEIDTKPRLEIDADEVACSHGTTVGQLDPQHVFYLRSRGLDEVAARSLLASGFASEVIQTLDNKALRTRLDRLLRDRLDFSEREGKAV